MGKSLIGVSALCSDGIERTFRYHANDSKEIKFGFVKMGLISVTGRGYYDAENDQWIFDRSPGLTNSARLPEWYKAPGTQCDGGNS